MDFNEFLTLETLFTFPVMVAVCIAFVQVFKNMFDKVLNNAHTYWVVGGTALFLTAFKSVYEFDATITFVTVSMTIVLWIVNAAIVSLAAMKGYEAVKNNV